MAEKDKKPKIDPEKAKAEAAARKAAKAKAAAEAEQGGGDDDKAPATPAPPARLIAHYREKVVPALQQKFGYTNIMAVPRLEKVVISMGLGKAVTSGEKGKMEQA